MSLGADSSRQRDLRDRLNFIDGVGFPEERLDRRPGFSVSACLRRAAGRVGVGRSRHRRRTLSNGARVGHRRPARGLQDVARQRRRNARRPRAARAGRPLRGARRQLRRLALSKRSAAAASRALAHGRVPAIARQHGPGERRALRRHHRATNHARRRPDLTRHILSAAAKSTGRGWRLDKATRSSQIDAAVALAMAVRSASAPKPTPPVVLGWI